MARKPEPIVFKVTVRVRDGEVGGGDVPGLLDMLRYEGGQVVSWDHRKDVFDVTVRVDDRFRHQPDRWRSFGIAPRYS